MITRDRRLDDCLRVFPGIVIEMGLDGTVLNSNGHLERLIGREITGTPFASALDDTSQEKLHRLLAPDAPTQLGDRLELILVAPRTLEVRTFLVQRTEPPDEPRIWLVEFVRDPELEQLHEELAAVNTDMVTAQRELTRERTRLARALAREQEARSAVERANDRIRALLAITDAALVHLDVDTLLERVLGILPGALSADTGSVLLVDEATNELVVRASYGLEEEVARHTRLRIGEGVRGQIAARGEPVIVADLATADVVSAPLRERVCSFMGVPLRVGDRVIGVVHVGTFQPREFSTDDLQFLMLVGERMASAIERTRLYEAERAARATADAAVAARDEVLGIVSHDLRNPLGAISGSASLLLELSLTEAQRQQQLALIKRAAQRATRLIEDLLDVTRIEAVGLTLERTPIEVQPLVREVHDSFRAQAEEKGITFRYDVASDLPRINADRDRIFQVLANLVGNAIKFTPRGGRIDVRATRSGDAVDLAVQDTGSGIPADEIPHLFERFWQARRAQRSGAGLGLTIAQAIVDAHDSTLRVRSEVGVGTEFSFSIR